MTLRRGISLVEVTISMVIVSITSLSVIQMFGVSAKTRALSSDRVRGLHLASDLLSEIASQHWADPAGGITSFGAAVHEYDGTTRLNYNDIDDYDGWKQSPPLLPDGTPVPGFDGWTRSVKVEFAVRSENAVVTSGTFERGKLITVTVERGGRHIAELSSFRSLDFDSARTQALPPSGEEVAE
jgi:type II secretory pathway pseudopilin PulG